MNAIRSLILAAIVPLVASTVVAGCGDENADADPIDVLTETLNNDQPVTSGTLDLTLSGRVDQARGANGRMSLSGVFMAGNEPGALPEFDLTGSASGTLAEQPVNETGGVTVTDDNAYIEFQGATYEVGAPLLESVRSLVERQASQAQVAAGATGTVGATGTAGAAASSFTAQCSTLIEQEGGDPAACEVVDIFSWFDLSNEGTADIEGAETIHIHGTLDIGEMVDNINAAIEASEIPDAAPISDEARSQIEATVSEFSFDLYSGAEDRLIRGVGITMVAGSPELRDSLGVRDIDIELSTRIGTVNEPQTIEAPANAQPIDDLLDQFGLDSASVQAALSGFASQPGGSRLEPSAFGG